MQELFSSGRVVDLIIVFMVVEAIALMLGRGLFARKLAIGDIASLLLPGLALLLALRAALVGAEWITIALWLLAALVAHLADLRRRLLESGSRH